MSHICEHEHDARDQEVYEPGDNLYPVINHPSLRLINGEGNPGDIIRPFNERWNDESVSTDDDLILSIPFTASVTLRAMVIRFKTPPGEIELYTRECTFDDTDPKERVRCIQTSEMVEYRLRVSKFTNLTVLGILIRGECEIQYLSLHGTSQVFGKAPEQVVYEAYPQAKKSAIEEVKLGF